MFGHTLTIDYETYFDADFTLRKMAPLEYIRDPRFKVHGAACKLDTAPAEWVTSDRLREYLAAVPWNETAAISHNSLFDQTILYEKYGISPVFRIDTLGLARALLPQDMDFDLNALALALGVGHKTDGGKALQAAKGIRQLPEHLENPLGIYACNDAEVCYKFFELLWPHLPEIECRLLNTTLRMGTEGVLRLNHATANEALTEAIDKRNQRIQNGGQDSLIYRSDAKFADLLRGLGCEPPTKISPTTGKTVYAFSKMDPAFIALLGEPEVAAQVDARLATKSTSDIKRIERLKTITALEPKTLPMPLNYCGAHTFRWCMRPEAEVLTRRGWVRMDKWNREPIMQWEESGNLTWCENPAKNVFPFTGNLIRAQAKGHDCAYTADHRLPLLTSDGTFAPATAQEWSTTRRALIVAGQSVEPEHPFTDEQLRLIVATQADGHPGLSNWDWMLRLSSRQARLVIEELAYWGGSKIGLQSSTLTTTNKEFAELIQALACMCGYGSWISASPREGRSDAHRVHLRRADKGLRVKTFALEPYEGEVYCPTTDTGYFVCRSNEAVFISGNSGGGKINPQNLKKGIDGRAGKLRMSIEAPDNHMICVADSAQIELRMNLWWCGQHDLLDMLRNGDDLYSYTATNVLGRHVDKTMKKERNFGKVVELGAGFGMGGRKFRATCAIGPMGNDPIHLSQASADDTIAKYREIHPFIKARWDWLTYFAIPSMMLKECHVEQGPVTFKHERVMLPNGLALLYPNLHMTDDGWEYGINGVHHRIYGGLLLENIIQALARVVVAEQLDLIDRTVARVVTMSHDEIVCISPKADAVDTTNEMLRIMSITPEWAPNLPLSAEGGFAKEYSK